MDSADIEEFVEVDEIQQTVQIYDQRDEQNEEQYEEARPTDEIYDGDKDVEMEAVPQAVEAAEGSDDPDLENPESLLQHL